jgi:hypothetical protein
VTLGMGIDVYPLALGGSTFGWTSDEATSRQVAFTRFGLTVGQRSALGDVSARVPSA